MSEHRTHRATVAAWCAVVAWAVVIFAMSAHTSSDLSTGSDVVAIVRRWLDGLQEAVLGPGMDAVSPIAHFCEYAVLGALVTLALRASGMRRVALMASVAIVACSLYGITDELHQILVPGRESDPMDWLVDTCGAALGTAVACTAMALRARHRDAGDRSVADGR